MKEMEPLLEREVESWQGFGDALRSEDREVFRRLLEKTWRYSSAIVASGKRFPTDPFLLTLVLIQQREIEWLRSQLEELRREANSSAGRRGLDT